MALAVGVGLATGVGVGLFKSGFEFFQVTYREPLVETLRPLLGDWGIVPVIALGGLIVGLFVQRFIGHERHHGVAGIMEATALAGGRLRYRRMPLKAALAAFTIGAGASVGPEDPSVQVGANLGSMFGQRLRLSDERVRLLVAAGVASGIASAFRAPIAGVFFALEVILGDISVGSFGAVVLAAVVASVFTQAIEVGGPELGIRAYTLGGPGELPLYVLLGVLMAPISAAFIRLLYWQQDFWHGLALPTPIKTMIAGAVVGVIAVFLPQIMGTGRETMNALLNEGSREFAVPLLLALVVGKMLATTISLGGGFVGGMFAPSLFVGAAFGSAFGHIVNVIFPGGLSANPAAYAMAGMAAAMTGVIRAPITAILLLFELTGDYNLILPIMLVTTVCLLLVGKLAPDGIYQHGLARKGIRLSSGRDIDLMQTISVGESMKPLDQSVRANLPAPQLDDEFGKTHTHGLVVLDSDGWLYGIVTLQDLARAREAGGLEGKTVGEIATRKVLTVSPEDSIAKTLQLIGGRDLGRIPVVAPDNPRKVVGILRRRDILRAYDIALQRKMETMHRHGQARLEAYAENEVIELRVAPESSADGKLISEIAWPQGCIVASVRREGHSVVARGNTQLRAGDLLTVVTAPEQEDALERIVEAGEEET
jgi:chloride channel protein, CIC family